MYRDKLNEYIEQNLDRIYRFSRNRIRNEYDAEDLTQNIIITALRCIKNLRDSEKLESWFWGVARNVHMKSLSDNSLREIPSEDYIVTEMYDSDSVRYSYTAKNPLDEYLKKEEIENVKRAVSTLAKIYRDVAVMYYIDELDYNSIAEKLDIPLSSVKWRLNQSKKIIKEEIEKMEYMNNGYRKAQKLTFNAGGSYTGYFSDTGYGHAHKLMDNLLVQNICICAYDKAKTITEISSELGVSADYIEDATENMVKSNILTQSSNKYQTNFPMFTKKDSYNTFVENYHFAQKYAQKIYDSVISIKDDIKNLSFCGSDKDFSKLIPMLMMTLKDNCSKDINFFNREKIPFKDIDSSWYLLGTTEESFLTESIPDISLNYLTFNEMSEYFCSTGDFPDCKNSDTATLFVKLLRGEVIDYDKESYNLAKLVEEEKIVKTSDGYKANVPAFSSDERKELLDILSPALELYTDVSRNLIKRSTEVVKEILPDRFKKESEDTTEFFGGYCAGGSIESALFNIFQNSGNKITRDMTAWYVYK